MKLSSLIGHVTEAYAEIASSRKPADHLIDLFFRSRKYLGSHDRRFIAETVYAMLRHRRRTEWMVSRADVQGNRHLLLCAATLLLERKVAPEVLDAEQLLPEGTVAALAALTECEPEGTAAAERLGLRYSFPDWMLERWFGSFGEEETESLCRSMNTPAPITLRVNTVRCSVDECMRSLKEEGIDSVRTEFSPVGLHIPKRLNVFQLETFRKGYFEVQDEGSQLLALLVDPKPRAKVVDACAGGGGKSLALAAIMKNRGEIFSLDIHEFRLEELKKRIRRAGIDTIRVRPVSEEESPEELQGAAEYVLVDAPCSGTGTIRRNPGMKWSVTPEMLRELHQKQVRILDQYSRCVAPGGTLVYATCSLMEEENAQVAEQFLAAHPEFEPLPPGARLQRYGLEALAGERFFRLMPNRHGTDGFFAAVFRRRP